MKMNESLRLLTGNQWASLTGLKLNSGLTLLHFIDMELNYMIFLRA